MGTANRDASQVTKRNRNKAENSYYQGWSAAVNSATPNSTLKAPASSGAEVLLEIRQGCTDCTIYSNYLAIPNPDPNTTLYPSNPSRGGPSGITGQS